MQKPNDYDQTIANPDGFEALPAGGYVCKIMEVKEVKSSTGKEMLKISLDIAEGEKKDFFANAYKADDRKEKKWGAVMHIVTEGDYGTANLKRFVTAVERSNKGFAVAWGAKFEACFKGKLVGCLFREEDYLNAMNEKKTAVKPFMFRTADKIREGVPVPERKELSDEDYDKAADHAALPDPMKDADGFMNIPDGIAEELPF